MDVLSRVLFHVDTREAYPFRAFADIDVEMAMLTERQLVLADLIALRQIGIEVIFSREAAVRGDSALRCQTHADGELDDSFIQHREHSGKTHADGAGVVVRRIAEARRAAAEDLRLRQKLRVDFQTDHGFIVRAHSFGFFLCHSVIRSYASATRSIVASSKCLPMICMPIGIPSASKPHGSDRPGSPARLTEIVKISDRYICSGSSVFSPILNAVVGAVGVMMTSQFLNASSKSFLINARTFCALR